MYYVILLCLDLIIFLGSCYIEYIPLHDNQLKIMSLIFQVTRLLKNNFIFVILCCSIQ
ncbi:hypothetical protein C1646_684160 [Rhizophagus diaphanus]|nr:hypothetical protein C1646_684160 [Rhizophagus diaphanus] [Rhizophagus sp. MUCL 43196]